MTLRCIIGYMATDAKGEEVKCVVSLRCIISHLARLMLTLATMSIGIAIPNPALAGEGKITRLLIEGEEFDGLRYYTFHNLDARGWYARESNCRYYGAFNGCAMHAVIHETASQRTMRKHLDEPLPAGEYRITIRVVGTVLARAFKRDNIIRITLGDASAEFQWQFIGRSFTWLPMQSIRITKPADEIAVTAVQFGGGGFIHLNEPQAATLCLDTIYITNDPRETKPPNEMLERAVRLGLPITDELIAGKVRRKVHYRPLHHNVIKTVRKPMAMLIELRSYDGRNNLLPNSSFELGMNDGWAATNVPYKFCHIFTDDDLDSRNPVHGRFCLRVPANANPFSRPYELTRGGKVTLSAFMRGEPQKVKLHLMLAKGNKPLLTTVCDVTSNWQRFYVTGKVTAEAVYVKVENPKALWLDAVQIEFDDLSEYAPRAKVEGSITTGALGNILYEGNVQLWLNFHNSGAQPINAQLRYRIADIRERIVAEGITQSIRVDAGETIRRRVDFGIHKRGIYSITFAVDGHKFPEGELVFVILPRPKKRRTRHELAANMDVLEGAYRLMRRMGFRWQLYCKFYPTFPNRIHPKPDTWNWFDDKVKLARQCGLRTLPCLWSTRVMQFMSDATRVPGKTMGITRNYARHYPNLRYPDLEKWRRYVRKVVSHYRTLRMWCIEDETELYYTPHDFAPIVRATVEAIRSIDRNIKIGTSMCPQYHEELLRYVGRHIDFLAASSFHATHWEARLIRRLQEQYRKPWYCIGVGFDNQPTFYHTLPHFKGAYADAIKTAHRLINLCIVQDAKIIGHYTGRLWNRYGHRNADFPLMDYDGTPLPHGFTYACVVLMLSDAIPLGDVEVGTLGIRAYLFKIRNSVGAVMWSTNAIEPFRARRCICIRLPLRRGRAMICDMFGNERDDVQWSSDGVAFDLTPEPTFIFGKGISRRQLESALRNARGDAERVSGFMTFAPRRLKGDCALDLQLRICAPAMRAKSSSGWRAGGVTIDMNVTPNQLMSRADWWLVDRVARLEHLADELCSVGMRTLIRASKFRHPIENAMLYAWILRDGESIAGIFDVLWLMRCWRMASARVDGDLSEWDGKSTAWLDYTYSWARFGRWLEQIYDGGEHLSEFFNTCKYVDVRGAIWCGWNDDGIFVGVRVWDDSLAPMRKDGELCDAIEIHLDGDVTDDDVNAPRTDDVIIRISLREGMVSERLANGAIACAKPLDDGWCAEAFIPHRALRIKPRVYDIIGIDIFLHDADVVGRKRTHAILRWAGGSRSTGHAWLLASD